MRSQTRVKLPIDVSKFRATLAEERSGYCKDLAYANSNTIPRGPWVHEGQYCADQGVIDTPQAGDGDLLALLAPD